MKPGLDRRSIVAGIAAVALPSVVSAQSVARAPRPDFNVRDFGAKGDGVAFDTAAIQAAIEACTKAGGGRVLLAGGVFRTRTIHLRSNVTLFIEAGAVLQGTADLRDYERYAPAYKAFDYADRALINADRAANVSILGKGAIDLSGLDFPPQLKDAPGASEWGASPYALRLTECDDLTIRDVTIRNCPMLGLRVVGSKRVVIDGIRIDNRVRIGCDGIEIVSCANVAVSNCHVDSWDDGICLKSASFDPCRNVVVNNCTVTSLCNGIKLGTESNGGFINVAISNCTIDGARSTNPAEWAAVNNRTDPWDSINGLNLMIVDGGTLDHVTVSNLVIRGVRTAIFVRLGNRGRTFSPGQPKPGVGVLKNVSISNVIAEVVDARYCSSISGEPGHPVENITLDNVTIIHPGGGDATAARRTVAELPATYPESIMWGPLPAYGIYCRHARGVTLRNLKLLTAAPERRPAMIFDDVADLHLDGLAAGNAGTEPLVRLTRVRGALIERGRPRAETFVGIDGADNSRIALRSNDLRTAATAVKTSGGFAETVPIDGQAVR